MALIDENGFTQKSQNEYFEELKASLLAIDPEWDLDPSSPDGLKLATDAETLGNIDEAILRAYNSKDPDRAVGEELDAIMFLSDLTRKAGTGSTVTLDFTGTSGTIVPQGSIFESVDTGSQWATNSDVTIVGGVASIVATCTEVGATSASAATITRSTVAIAGLATVTNPSTATLGLDRETDSLARVRRYASVSNPGGNQLDSTFAAAADVASVSHVKIYENDTDSVDAQGQPANSVDILVEGGDQDEIAKAIYDNRSPGAFQHQSGTAVDVAYVSPTTGNSKTIKFSRPTKVPIITAVNVTSDGSLPFDIEDRIKESIVNYSLGVIDGVSSAFNQSGYAIGEDIFAGQLYTAVNSIIGAYGGSYVTSITVNGGSSVAIAFNELSEWLEANIAVNVS